MDVAIEELTLKLEQKEAELKSNYRDASSTNGTLRDRLVETTEAKQRAEKQSEELGAALTSAQVSTI